METGNKHCTNLASSEDTSLVSVCGHVHELRCSHVSVGAMGTIKGIEFSSRRPTDPSRRR